MSADIEKVAVFDSRIVQSRPKYAVEKGALSLTNAPFCAISQSASQHTYNIYVPSENVYVGRDIRWTSTAQFQMTLTNNTGAAIPVGGVIATAGLDWAFAPFPLTQMVSTTSVTINDTTSVINTQDVLTQVLRLTDYKANRLQRTCPTMLDTFASYDDAFGSLSNPLASVTDNKDHDNRPNGEYSRWNYTDNNGVVGATYVSNGVTVNITADQSVVVGGATPLANGGSVVLYVSLTSTEKLVVSPFIFAEQHQEETGLFGINNIQVILNMNSSVARAIRSTTRNGRAISNVALNTGAPVGAFQNSILNVQFFTPSLDVPLPPKSVVPYMEFPRYITTVSQNFAPAGTNDDTQLVQSQTITLPQIPDLLIIYAKPQTYLQTDGDFLMPLDTEAASALTVNFDNFSGLLSSATAEQLYTMSVENGLDMDWDTWRGIGRSAAGGYTAAGSLTAHTPGGKVPLVGGALILKPSKDLTLQTGQAPSLVGNFTLQFNIRLRNTLPRAVNGVQLFVITANSGFFESIRGSSRIIKGVLSEQDIISAPAVSGVVARSSLVRMVGGLSFGSLANAFNKAKEIYEQTKPIVSGVVSMLPSEGTIGQIKSGAQAIGYGTGGGTGGRKKGSLMSRLM